MSTGEERTRILVEEDPVHIDHEAMTALIEEIESLGHEAEPTEQEFLFEDAWWDLVLRATTDATSVLYVAEHVARWASPWYKRRNADPPRLVHLYGPDGKVLRSVEVPGD